MTIAIDLELPIVLKLPVDVCIPIIIGSKKIPALYYLHGPSCA